MALSIRTLTVLVVFSESAAEGEKAIVQAANIAEDAIARNGNTLECLVMATLRGQKRLSMIKFIDLLNR